MSGDKNIKPLKTKQGKMHGDCSACGDDHDEYDCPMLLLGVGRECEGDECEDCKNSKE